MPIGAYDEFSIFHVLTFAMHPPYLLMSYPVLLCAGIMLYIATLRAPESFLFVFSAPHFAAWLGVVVYSFIERQTPMNIMLGALAMMLIFFGGYALGAIMSTLALWRGRPIKLIALPVTAAIVSHAINLAAVLVAV